MLAATCLQAASGPARLSHARLPKPAPGAWARDGTGSDRERGQALSRHAFGARDRSPPDAEARIGIGKSKIVSSEQAAPGIEKPRAGPADSAGIPNSFMRGHSVVRLTRGYRLPVGPNSGAFVSPGDHRPGYQLSPINRSPALGDNAWSAVATFTTPVSETVRSGTPASPYSALHSSMPNFSVSRVDLN